MVPTGTLPSDKIAGVNVTGAVPVPVSDAVCVPVVALSVIVRVPVRTPTAVGVKITRTVQLPPAARVFGLLGQLFVWT